MSLKSIPTKFNPQIILFFLILFFLPQQFGPHFWPSFSLVHGIRVDYLSPAIYISDVLIFLLFLLSFKNIFSNSLIKSFFSRKLFLFLVLIVLFPLFYTFEPLSLLYKLFKLFEVMYLGLFAAVALDKKHLFTALWILSLAAFLEALLGIGEFIKQGSLNGIFYFFGERFFTPSTLGEAVINTTRGLLVRPYATFPHPNILAFFLFMGAVFSSFVSHHEKNIAGKYTALFFFSVIEVCLFLTFSRVMLAINILFLLYSFLLFPIFSQRKHIKRIIVFCSAVILLGIFFASFSFRFFSLSSILNGVEPRTDLTLTSFQIFSRQPLFGVGLSNSFYYEGVLQKDFSPTRLQPVHNIFLLILSEAGILGLLVFWYFSLNSILVLYHKTKGYLGTYSFYEMVFILFTAFLVQGMFDHFFFTTQQGLLMASFLFGLSYNKNFRP
ncbi:MAG: O-antigen ligase family protein [Candidatus Levyibacteriota bacterium]